MVTLEGYPTIHSSVTEVMPLEVDTDGTVRIGKTRVTLDVVIAAFADGATAEEIVQQYPSLQLADVYHVIGYYLRHPSEVEAYRQQRRAQAAAVRQQNEARFDPYGVRDRLLARRVSQAQ
jgi:uncharacterized protein (DUF433 family)